jgi:hypothetical protein
MKRMEGTIPGMGWVGVAVVVAGLDKRVPVNVAGTPMRRRSGADRRVGGSASSRVVRARREIAPLGIACVLSQTSPVCSRMAVDPPDPPGASNINVASPRPPVAVTQHVLPPASPQKAAPPVGMGNVAKGLTDTSSSGRNCVVAASIA